MRTTDAVAVKLKPVIYRMTSEPLVHYSAPHYKLPADLSYSPLQTHLISKKPISVECWLSETR
jgi:hypothetical protein